MLLGEEKKNLFVGRFSLTPENEWRARLVNVCYHDGIRIVNLWITQKQQPYVENNAHFRVELLSIVLYFPMKIAFIGQKASFGREGWGD